MGTYSLGQGNISFTDLLQLSLPLSSIGDCGVLVDLGLGERELLESSDDIVIGNSRHVWDCIEVSSRYDGRYTR